MEHLRPSLDVLNGCGGSGHAGRSVTEENLYSFGSSSTDAMGPVGDIVQGNDGSFCGTMSGG